MPFHLRPILTGRRPRNFVYSHLFAFAGHPLGHRHSFLSYTMPWKPATGGNGQKPRAASSKSIRGHISGPIPIPDPMDEEFPMRDQTATVARNADEASSDSHLIPPEPSSNQSYKASHLRAASAGNIDPLIAHQRQHPLSAPRRASTLRGSSVSQHDRFTRVSDQADGRDSKASKNSKPQRKKSTIRTALGKLFGRKKKSETNEKAGLPDWKTSDASPLLSNKQHRSVCSFPAKFMRLGVS